MPHEPAFGGFKEGLANTLLTQYLDRLIDNYPYIVIDNEAGMEHISRLTTNNIEVLLIVSDPTRRGVQAASRIVDLTNDLNLRIRKKFLIVNQVKEGQEEAVRRMVSDFPLELLGTIPEDPEVMSFDLEGRPTMELSSSTPAVSEAYRLFDEMIKE